LVADPRNPGTWPPTLPPCSSSGRRSDAGRAVGCHRGDVRPAPPIARRRARAGSTGRSRTGTRAGRSADVDHAAPQACVSAQLSWRRGQLAAIERTVRRRSRPMGRCARSSGTWTRTPGSWSACTTEATDAAEPGWPDVDRLLARAIGELVALEETVRAMGRRPERMGEELERVHRQVQARRRMA